MVEYSLGLVFLVIASLGAVQFLEDGTTDEFNDRADRAGAPDLAEASDDGSGGDPPPDGGDGGGGEVTPVAVFFGGFSGESSHGNPSKWTAVIDVSVNDGTGDGVDGARVTGYWSYDSGSGVITEPVTCNQTNNQGECRFQISNLPAGAATVTFTVTEIGGGVPPVSYDGGDQVSDPIARPSGGPS